MHTIWGAKVIATRFIHLYKWKWDFCVGYFIYVHNLYKKMTPYSRCLSPCISMNSHTPSVKYIAKSNLTFSIHCPPWYCPLPFLFFSCTCTARFQTREFTDSVFYFSLSSQLIFSWDLSVDRRFLLLWNSVLGKDRLSAEEEEAEKE